jgi:hypothetical protein
MVCSFIQQTKYETSLTLFEGLALPSKNAVVLSLLENYLPTLFATFLEPFWVVLNRLLCLLRPFDELNLGNALSSKSIGVKYTSLPPQLVIWRAVRSGHYLLAVVCLVAISANVLAVALSGLFTEELTSTSILISSTQTMSSRFNSTPDIARGASAAPITYLDHFYVTMSKIHDGTHLPPWIDEKYFYIPFTTPNTLPGVDLRANDDQKIERYSAATRGFGVTTDCKALKPAAIDSGIVFGANNSGQDVMFSSRHTLPTGRNVTCISSVLTNYEDTLQPGKLTTGATALEVVRAMASVATAPGQSVEDGGFCESLLVMGWTRVGSSVLEAAMTNGTDGRSFEYIFMGCSPRLVTAKFDIDVNEQGYVLNSNRITDFDKDLESYSTMNETAALLQQITRLIAPTTATSFGWHNDTITADWMNSLLKAYLKNSDIINPATSLPNITTIIPAVEDIFQQLSAVIIGLNPQIFASALPANVLDVRVTIQETRIFNLCMVLLGIHLITAAVFYARRPKRFLPRMPTSVANLIAYVAMSRTLQDTNKEASNCVKEEELRYAYGRFTGMDGKQHVGIERAHLVSPVHPKNPNQRSKVWNRQIFSRREEEQTWI